MVRTEFRFASSDREVLEVAAATQAGQWKSKKSTSGAATQR